MVARQTLGARHHLLTADDADVVHGLQLFRRGVRVAAWGGELGGKRRKKNPFLSFLGAFEGDVGKVAGLLGPPHCYPPNFWLN